MIKLVRKIKVPTITPGLPLIISGNKIMNKVGESMMFLEKSHNLLRMNISSIMIALITTLSTIFPQDFDT